MQVGNVTMQYINICVHTSKGYYTTFSDAPKILTSVIIVINRLFPERYFNSQS